MEAVAYVFDRDNLPPFPRFLELLIQDVDGKTLTRKEFAARLTKVGFKTTDQSVSQWINEERTPPPGLPYYTSQALSLDDDVRRDLSWSYTTHYKDKRRTNKKKDLDPVPDEPGLTIENEAKLDQQRAKIDQLADEERQKRRERENGESTSGPSSRA